MKIYKNDTGHMTKLVAIPIYGINPLKIFFPGTIVPNLTKLGMKHRRLKHIIFCSNDDPGLTLTYFTAGSNFAT